MISKHGDILKSKKNISALQLLGFLTIVFKVSPIVQLARMNYNLCLEKGLQMDLHQI